MENTQYVGRKRARASGSRRTRQAGGTSPRVREHAARRPYRGVGEARLRRGGGLRKGYPAGTFRRRRAVAGGVVAAALALVAGLIFPLPWATGETPPISASGAASDVALAEVGEVRLSTPISPEKLTGLGYHPDGAGLLEMEPRGEDRSAGILLRLLPGGSSPGDVGYHTMDPAGRAGPETGALDVGARAGTVVRAPVSGIVTAIRPDSQVPDANLIEIQSEEAPNVRVYVSLVGEISPGMGVESPVSAGETKLGTVAHSEKVFDSQLSSYAGGSGNHVTISAARID